MAIVLVEQLGLEWDAFRAHLIAAIADDSARPYWDSWAVALDSFVATYVPDPATNSGNPDANSGNPVANSGEKRAP